MKSNRTHTPPPKIEDLGDGTSYYNFNVVESETEDGYPSFDYDQVRVSNPVTLGKIQVALNQEGYDHEPEISL